ncbi:hypothetical protein FRB96_009627 [Tulasnella sp. 330]|nr:hypothetical protein FRB96_009627 [Tulasnella sp. 330]
MSSAAVNTKQPAGRNSMSLDAQPTISNVEQQQACQKKGGAMRIRGGGAACGTKLPI